MDAPVTGSRLWIDRAPVSFTVGGNSARRHFFDRSNGTSTILKTGTWPNGSTSRSVRLEPRSPAEHIWSLLWRQLHAMPFSSQTVRKPNPGNRAHVDAMIDEIERWVNTGNDNRFLLLLDEADAFLAADALNDFRESTRLKGLMDRTDRRFKVVLAGLHHVLRVTETVQPSVGAFRRADSHWSADDEWGVGSGAKAGARTVAGGRLLVRERRGSVRVFWRRRTTIRLSFNSMARNWYANFAIRRNNFPTRSLARTSMRRIAIRASGTRYGSVSTGRSSLINDMKWSHTRWLTTCSQRTRPLKAASPFRRSRRRPDTGGPPVSTGRRTRNSACSSTKWLVLASCDPSMTVGATPFGTQISCCCLETSTVSKTRCRRIVKLSRTASTRPPCAHITARNRTQNTHRLTHEQVGKLMGRGGVTVITGSRNGHIDLVPEYLQVRGSKLFDEAPAHHEDYRFRAGAPRIPAADRRRHERSARAAGNAMERRMAERGKGIPQEEEARTMDETLSCWRTRIHSGV